MKWLIALLVLLSMPVLGQFEVQAQDAPAAEPAVAVPEASTITAGKKVKFDYTLSVDGQVVEDSQKAGALEYTQGDNALIPGLTKEMEGLKVGDEKTIVVSPDEGYGQIDPKAVQEVPKSAISPDIQLSVGLLLQMNDPQGNAFPAVVKEIKDDKVVLDFNHPLAGKALTFVVKIVDIQ